MALNVDGSFTFRANDGALNSNIATYPITVNEKVLKCHIFANGKDDLFADINDKNVEGLVAVDLVVYKQLVKRKQGKKITFNLFKKPAKVIQVPEDKKEKIEDQIRL